MFIAHIPVGLGLARIISRRPLNLSVVLVASFGAIFPDLDLIRFYFFDNHQRHHHDYWTHIPGIWLMIILAWALARRFLGRPFGIVTLIFFGAVFSHLILDTMSGAIEWLWPFFDKGFHLVTVPATHAKWYISFLTHWTFAVEIFISLVALSVAFYRYEYKNSKDAGAIASQAETGHGG